MIPEMKLVISQCNKTIHSMTQEVNSQNLGISLEQFQTAVNTALTKMIEECGDSGDFDMGVDDGSDSEEDDLPITPSKRRK